MKKSFNQNGFSQVFIIIIVALVSAGLAGAGVWYWQQQEIKKIEDSLKTGVTKPKDEESEITSKGTVVFSIDDNIVFFEEEAGKEIKLKEKNTRFFDYNDNALGYNFSINQGTEVYMTYKGTEAIYIKYASKDYKNSSVSQITGVIKSVVVSNSGSDRYKYLVLESFGKSKAVPFDSETQFSKGTSSITAGDIKENDFCTIIYAGLIAGKVDIEIE